MSEGEPSSTFPNLSRVHLICWQENMTTSSGSPSTVRISDSSASETKRIVGSSVVPASRKCLRGGGGEAGAGGRVSARARQEAQG